MFTLSVLQNNHIWNNHRTLPNNQDDVQRRTPRIVDLFFHQSNRDNINKN